jgi:hypothetical protein
MARTIEKVRLSEAEGSPQKLQRKRAILIATIVVLAFCARSYKLGSASLAEDEANKLFAVWCYKQGDFTANAEHPMLMKLLCLISTSAADAWNRFAGGRLAISEEVALRFPNALFGALTVIPLFLLANAILGFRVSLLASLMWALGLNAIWFNRITKEDTLMVFFMLWGYYLYNRAKSCSASDPGREERLYILSGIAFGLMMASKYFPHYYGLLALFYHLAGHDSRNNRPLTRRLKASHFGAMVLAFMALNPALFTPQTWRYLIRYVSEGFITHHGYLMMDRIYQNDISETPGGMPWYFYLLYFGVKIPPPLLLAFAIGFVEIFRRREPSPDSRGYLFLRIMLLFWLVPMSIVGSKFLRYTLALMPFFYMTAAVGAALLWDKAIRPLSGVWSHLPATAIFLIFVVAPGAVTVWNLPHLSLYVNAFGGGRAGYYFPHDEFYDLGVRECLRYIAENAPRGASVASEVPGVSQYYLERFGRSDIRVQVLSNPRFNLESDPPDFVLLQRGRYYFENQRYFGLIEDNYPLVWESRFRGAAASRVYKLIR